MNDITLVTAASSNHFRSLCQFLGTVPQGVRVIVYDIGLSPSEREQLPSVRSFDFDAYPPFLRLSAPDAGAYAWKPVIVSDVCREFGGIVIWCDAGNKIQYLPHLFQAVKHCGVYSAISAGTFQEWTHPSTRMLLPNSYRFDSLSMRNAACVGVDWNVPRAQYLIHDWKTLALRKELSLPDGANRSNHRHDQSLLTYLLYAYNLPLIDEKVGHTIHNDIDNA